MRTWMKWVGVAIVVLVVGAVINGASGSRPAVREIAMSGVTDIQIGSADLTLVNDGQDKLIVRTTRRQMPWVMARRTGPLLELGLPDDADPRAYIAMLGAKQYPDRPAFELHTRTLEKITVAGGGSLAADGWKSDAFVLTTVGANACTLRGVDIGSLRVEMSDGKETITVSGKADSLYVMNSSEAKFDGSKLVAGTATVLPGGSGTSIVDIAGSGIKEYPGGQ